MMALLGTSTFLGMGASKEQRAVLRPHDRLLAKVPAKLLQALPLRNTHVAELCAAAQRLALQLMPERYCVLRSPEVQKEEALVGFTLSEPWEVKEVVGSIEA